MEFRWLKAHNKTITPTQNSINPQEPISISDSSPRRLDIADDLGIVYYAEYLGDDMEKADDLLHFFSPNKASPSQVGRGRIKDIRLFPRIKDHLNNPDLEDEEDMEIDEDPSENLGDEDLNEDTFSVSPLNCI